MKQGILKRYKLLVLNNKFEHSILINIIDANRPCVDYVSALETLLKCLIDSFAGPSEALFNLCLDQ